MDEEIFEFINNPKLGLYSVDKLLPKLKAYDLNISRKDLKQLLNEQLFNQLTKVQVKPKHFNQIYAPSVLDNLQMDIMVYNRYRYHNYQYILCVVDVYSRYAVCRAMTNRNNETILKNMKDIFSLIGIPKSINCDLEFDTKEIEKYADKHQINFYFSEANDVIKNGIVERFNRTISNLIQKYRISSGDYNWPKYLNDIVDNYNTTIHSTIKARPIDVFSGDDLNHRLIQKKIVNRFEIGDVVRTKNEKSIFEKGDAITYSKDTYIVDEIDGNRVYLIGVNRSYQPHQLIKANSIAYRHKNPEQEIEHAKQTKEAKQRRVLKRDNIDEYNLRSTKRVVKGTKHKDYVY